MILPSVLLLAVLVGCQSGLETAGDELAGEWQALRRVDGEI